MYGGLCLRNQNRPTNKTGTPIATYPLNGKITSATHSSRVPGRTFTAPTAQSNAALQRSRATGVRHETEGSSRGSLDALCSLANGFIAIANLPRPEQATARKRQQALGTRCPAKTKQAAWPVQQERRKPTVRPFRSCRLSVPRTARALLQRMCSNTVRA